jgi:uncharacterized protein (TIGR00251 family)
MRISVDLHPNSSKQEIIKIDQTHFVVYLHKPAVENKANLELIKVLAEYFEVSKSSVNFTSGLKSKKKVLEITI